MNKKSLKKRSLAIDRTNSTQFNILKSIEEANELSLILLHKKTKEHTSNPVDTQKIIDEIGDMQRKLWFLKNHFGKKLVKQRIKEKIEYLEQKKGLS
jgi:hypothetical protein